MRYPNLYLIGAARSATTTLHAQLAKLPEVYAPSQCKEPAFFHFHGTETLFHGCKPLPTRAYQREEKAYLNLYAGWQDETYAIDASTYYLADPETAKAIRSARPDAKAFAIIREPVARAYSHYLMEVRDGWVKENFAKALAIEIEQMKIGERAFAGHYAFIRQSLYLEGVKAFLDAFGAAAFRIYRFDDLVQSDHAVMEDLERFLGISLLGGFSEGGILNEFAQDRLPALTTALNVYSHSALRELVNRLTPRTMRDKGRVALTRLRQRPAKKPPLPDDALRMLKKHLRDDYARSLEFARENGILHEQ